MEVSVLRSSSMADFFFGHTQSPVALAISSPTFLGERPRGPIFGASADEAPTSPPVARRWMIFSSLGSIFGAEADCKRVSLSHFWLQP